LLLKGLSLGSHRLRLSLAGYKELTQTVELAAGEVKQVEAKLQSAGPKPLSLAEVEEALIQTKAKSGQDVLNFPIRLNNQMAALGGVVESADSAPTQQSYEVFEMLSKAIDEQVAKWKSIVATDVKAYNDLVKQQDVPALMLKAASETR